MKALKVVADSMAVGSAMAVGLIFTTVFWSVAMVISVVTATAMLAVLVVMVVVAAVRSIGGMTLSWFK